MTPSALLEVQARSLGTRRFERLIEWALFLCAFVSIATTAGIIVVLAVETLAFLREVAPVSAGA